MNKTVFVIEPTRHDIVMTREFDAPRELVFKAMTDPELVPRWWGPTTASTVVEVMEVRRAGAWRWVLREADGLAFHGVYHDVVVPERLVYTLEFEGMPGHAGLVTLKLEEIDGKTKLTETSLFPSFEDRAAVISTGMQSGAIDSMDRLEELLANAEVLGGRPR